MSRTDDMLTLNEAAEQLGVHYMTAYRYVRTGRLPGVKEGNEWRVARADVEAFAAPDPVAPRTRRRIDHAARLEDRLTHGDEAGAWTIVEAAMGGGLTPDQVYEGVITPAMRSVGDRWANNELTVDQEHLATNVVLRLIGRLGPRFARRGRKRGTVVLGAPPGDAHGIPLALVGDLLRSRGFDVIDLGPDVPAPSFAHAVRGADRLIGVGLCATRPDNDANIVDALTAIRAVTDVPVVLGGGGVDGPAQAASLGASAHTASTAEVLEHFEQLVASRTA